MLSAHLGTVFGVELDVSVEPRGPRLGGPGISANARGLAVLVAVAEALVRARVATAHPVLFRGDDGEEGSGDLRGVKHLFARDGLQPAALIALDGAGVERIVHRAPGSRRYRATYAAPGGHSCAAFGVANAANAVGRAISILAERPTPHALLVRSSVWEAAPGSTPSRRKPSSTWTCGARTPSPRPAR